MCMFRHQALVLESVHLLEKAHENSLKTAADEDISRPQKLLEFLFQECESIIFTTFFLCSFVPFGESHSIAQSTEKKSGKVEERVVDNPVRKDDVSERDHDVNTKSHNIKHSAHKNTVSRASVDSSNSDGDDDGDDDVVIEGSDRRSHYLCMRMKNCVIRSTRNKLSQFGIRSSAPIDLSRVRISKTEFDGIRSTSEVKADRCSFSRCHGAGVWIAWDMHKMRVVTSCNRITRCSFDHCVYGMKQANGHLILDDCIVSNCNIGVACSARCVDVTNSHIHNCTMCGLLLSNSYPVIGRLTHNLIHDTENCVVFECESGICLVEGNEFGFYSKHGIMLDCERYCVKKNTFVSVNHQSIALSDSHILSGEFINNSLICTHKPSPESFKTSLGSKNVICTHSISVMMSDRLSGLKKNTLHRISKDALERRKWFNIGIPLSIALVASVIFGINYFSNHRKGKSV